MFTKLKKAVKYIVKKIKQGVEIVAKTIKVMGTMILGAAAGGLISANVIPDKPDEVVLENKLEEGENNYDEVK